MTAPLFSLCHATRRFPQWEETQRTWFESCDSPAACEYVLGVDVRDYDRQHMKWQPWGDCGNVYADFRTELVDSAAKAWNVAVRLSRGRFIICVADDLFPPPHWDTEIKKRLPDFSKEAVLYPNFGGNPGLIMFPMMTRAYLERLSRDHGYQGGAWYPEYFGMRADDDFTECARMDGVIIEAPDLKFEHRCPNYGLAEWDDTYCFA